MAMTIDDSCESKPMSKEEIVDILKTMVFGAQAFERFDAKERETLDKAWNIIDQYENRLKADLVAMLEELKKEIDEMQCLYVDFAHYVNEYDVSNLIQQKINSLKENENESYRTLF